MLFLKTSKTKNNVSFKFVEGPDFKTAMFVNQKSVMTEQTYAT